MCKQSISSSWWWWHVAHHARVHPHLHMHSYIISLLRPAAINISIGLGFFSFDSFFLLLASSSLLDQRAVPVRKGG